MSDQSAVADLDVDTFRRKYAEFVANVEIIIRGKTSVVEQALTCLLAKGHLLIEDVPGQGKTQMAKALANSIHTGDLPQGQRKKAAFRRVSCTPDLLPTDITGVNIFDQVERRFKFRPGAIFGNMVLADEINRASPKTQSAFLEAMQENTVTVDAEVFKIPLPFMIIATQNPIEMEGTYPLPEAQIDRFMMKISVGYPDANSEVEVLAHHAADYAPERLGSIISLAELLEMQEIARNVHVSYELRHYIVALVARTRTLPEVRLPVSTRGALALEAAARVQAASEGRGYVVPDDVKMFVEPVLHHRLILEADAELAGITAENLLKSVVASVPVPQLTAEAGRW